MIHQPGDAIHLLVPAQICDSSHQGICVAKISRPARKWCLDHLHKILMERTIKYLRAFLKFPFFHYIYGLSTFRNSFSL